jgi:hypothetical protein
MAVFSVNQVRHLYVATAYSATVNENSNVGTIGGVKVLNDGFDKELYFQYKGADTVLKSDRIQLKNLSYGKAIDASKMLAPLKSIKVSLSADVNGGAPVVGQDYILRIAFKQFYGMSDEDQYFKDAAVHVTSAINTAAKFMAAMKDALDKAFSRELNATKTSNPYLTFTVSGSDLIITEKPQDYIVGIGAQERVYFDIFPTTIYAGGDDVVWGTVADVTPKSDLVAGTNALGNGPRIADLEWFCMGERGDQYRGIGYPNDITTKLLVDPTQEYHVLELHFAFTDTGVNSYRSEKDITVVAPATEAGKTALNGLIGAINTAAGIEINTLE